MTRHECYGNMFPSVNSPRTGVPLRGKVFSIELQLRRRDGHRHAPHGGRSRYLEGMPCMRRL